MALTFYPDIPCPYYHYGETYPPLFARCQSSFRSQTTALKSIKSLAPLLDRILVQRVKAEAKTKGGLFLPESSVKELNEATVLAVGPGGLDKDGKRIAPSVVAGDKVLIPQVCIYLHSDQGFQN